MPLIRNAASTADIGEIRVLFREYETAIGVDLCFQGFTEELTTLPGRYAPPAGRLYLAVDDSIVLGCVGLRPLGAGECEMKRLYVRPQARARGLGRLLAVSVVEAARATGYRRILLDTLPSMKEAIALYRSLGFGELAPYCHNPIAGALYFGLELQAA